MKPNEPTDLADALEAAQEMPAAQGSPITAVAPVPENAAEQRSKIPTGTQESTGEDVQSRSSRTRSKKMADEVKKETPKVQIKSYFRSELDQFFPSADHLRIWRTREDGTLVMCRDATKRELENAGSIETLLQRYVYPKFPASDYFVALIGPNGEEMKKTPIAIDPPMGTAPLVPEPMPAAPALPAVNPFAQLKEAQETLASIRGDGKGSSDTMALMMLMQMQQPRPIEQPRTDPALLAVLERLGQPPPPPPPSLSAADIASAVATAIGPLLAKPQQQMDPVALFEKIPTWMETAKKVTGADKVEQEIRELRKRLEDNDDPPGIFDELKKLDAFYQFGERMFKRNGTSGGDSIIGGMRDILNSLPETFDSYAKARERVARADIAETREERAAKKTHVESKPVEKRMAFPAGTAEHVEPLIRASGDPERIKAGFELVKFLGKAGGDWKKVAVAMRASIIANDGKKLTEYVKVLMTGLYKDGRLSKSVASSTIMAVAKNIGEVMSALRGEDKSNGVKAAAEEKPPLKVVKPEAPVV